MCSLYCYLSRHVIRFNAFDDRKGGNLHCANLYSDIARLAFPGDQMGPPQQDVYEAADKFAGLFEVLASDLAIPKLLREVGIENNKHIELLATEAMKQTRLLPNNAREVTLNDALDLYQKAF